MCCSTLCNDHRSQSLIQFTREENQSRILLVDGFLTLVLSTMTFDDFRNVFIAFKIQTNQIMAIGFSPTHDIRCKSRIGRDDFDPFAFTHALNRFIRFK